MNRPKFLKNKNEFKEKQKRRIYVKRVEELYFGKKNLKHLESFEEFKNLKFLWLNENKILNLGTCLRSNILLVELYLHNNKLFSVTGCLQHLSCLEVLLLHNNYLANLQSVLHEFRNMYCLQTLNLFDNPVAFEHNYKIRVISSIPSLRIFDRNDVTAVGQSSKWIRDSRNQILNYPTTAVLHQLLSASQNSTTKSAPAKRKKSATGSMSVPEDKEKDKEDKRDEKCHKTQNSILIYNTFNWKKIPSSKDKQTLKKKNQAEIICHIYK